MSSRRRAERWWPGPPRGLGHDGQRLSNEQQLAPSLLDVNTRPDAPNHEEVWFWDLRGYLVLPGVMDREWLAQCNAALDSPFAEANRRPVGFSSSVVGEYPDYEGCSQTIAPGPGHALHRRARPRRPGPIPHPSATAFDA